QGQVETAFRIMKEVVQEHGGNPEAWGQLARLHYAHDQLEEAEAAIEKAFAINPNYPFGLMLRSVFRMREGELAEALLLAREAEGESARLAELARVFERLTRENAGDGPAWFNLAVAHAWLGENEKALEAIDRYLPLEEDEARAETAAALAEVLRTGVGLE